MLYIDPGTGSMLFTILIGTIGAAYYSIRTFGLKLKTKIGAGTAKTDAGRVPLAVFSDSKRYFTVFKPVLDEIDRRGIKTLYLTASEDDPIFSASYANISAEHIGTGDRMFSRLNSLNAAVVLSTTPGLDVYQWKRSPRVSFYVHIPHAASEICLYRMFGIDYYDAVLLSGEYQENDVRDLETLRSLPEKELVLTGIPYMDVMAARFAREGNAPPHPKTVLLAPSWGKSAIFSVYGSGILDKLLETGYNVIVRPHPQSFQSEPELINGIMERYPASDRLEWNRDADNFEVLRRSDILISDFSGVIFDFTLIFDRPVIYTDPEIDLSPYDAWWLGRPLWTFSALPRLGRRLTSENSVDLKTLIDETLSDTMLEEGRAQVREETWAHFGEGARLCADYLARKIEEFSMLTEEDKS